MKRLDLFDIDTIKYLSGFFGFITAVFTMGIGLMLKETGINIYGVIGMGIEIAECLLFTIVVFSEDETLIEVDEVLQLVMIGMTSKEA